MSRMFSLVGQHTNPYYHSASSTIHLPFPSTEVDLHKLEFFHEHTHFVQALTTTLGIYNFKGVAGKAFHLFNALVGRDKIFVPFDRWAAQESNDDLLITCSKYREHHNEQLKIALGQWILQGIADVDEFVIFKSTANIGQHKLDLFHIARKFKDELVGVPIQLGGGPQFLDSLA